MSDLKTPPPGPKLIPTTREPSTYRVALDLTTDEPLEQNSPAAKGKPDGTTDQPDPIEQVYREGRISPGTGEIIP